MELTEDVLLDVFELWSDFLSLVQRLINSLTPVED